MSLPALSASALDLIGHTPLLRLARIAGDRGTLLAKAEFLQPGASVKDRAARSAIEAARADGRLAPGQAVVEMTSGNMGAGLAVVCAALGHPFVAFMSAGNSIERNMYVLGRRQGANSIERPLRDGGEIDGPQRQSNGSLEDSRRVQQIVDQVRESRSATPERLSTAAGCTC